MWRIFFLIPCFTVLSLKVFSQDKQEALPIYCDTVNYYEEDFVDSMGYYEHLYGQNTHVKIKDRKLKLAFYVALRHYPELKHVRLTMRLKTISATMQAQPFWDFLFRSREGRHYQIFVNETQENKGMYYKDLSFNSLVGWIGHELAHILDYSKKENSEMLSFITSYVTSKKAMRHTECKADETAIRHGLGKQLLDGVNYFYHNNRISRKYRERHKSFYLTPEQIVGVMNEECLH